MNRNIAVPALAILLNACAERPAKQALPGSALQRHCMANLTRTVVHDIFSPPVSARIYAYATLAYFEALRPARPGEPSLLAAFRGFAPPPAYPGPEGADFRLSATVAFHRVARGLVFSDDSLSRDETVAMEAFPDMPAQRHRQSVQWGEKIAALILERAGRDNYRATRSMPRYSVFPEAGRWQQTPPDYGDATEPHWARILPLRMDSAGACRPPSPPPFSLETASAYHSELMEVYRTSQSITPQMDTVARFWDDNPFVSQHVGHFTYATKKTTPAGHWMGIAGILSGIGTDDEFRTAKAYALTAAAIFDGFISCWEEKFRSRTVRPITVIRAHIDPAWNSLLQTPSFPEYTSGHSVISGAAALVLEAVYGKGLAFTDTTEMPYLGLRRSFPSIAAAAEESSVSRLYGGIHFRSALRHGLEQGRKVGGLFLPLVR